MTPEQEKQLIEYVDSRINEFEPGKFYQFLKMGKEAPFLVPVDCVRPTRERQANIVTFKYFDRHLGEKLAFALEAKTTICQSGGIFWSAIKVLVDEEVFYLPLAKITVTLKAMGGIPARKAMMSFDFLRFFYCKPYPEGNEEQ